MLAACFVVGVLRALFGCATIGVPFICQWINWARAALMAVTGCVII
jgi:hypothetical protein